METIENCITSNAHLFAEVIIASSSKEVDRVFNYLVPESIIANKLGGQKDNLLGMRVSVPFGKGNKLNEGFVIGISSDLPEGLELAKVKSIIGLLDDFPVFSKTSVELAKWMRDKYYTTMANCLKCVMPSGISMKNEYVAEIKSDAGNIKLSPKQKEIFDYLSNNSGAVSQRELGEQFGASAGTVLKALETKGVVLIKQINEVKDFVQRVKFVSLDEESEQFEKMFDSVIAKNDKQSKVLQYLSENGAVALSDVKAFVGISDSPIKTLEKYGLVKIEVVEVRRNIMNSYSEEDKKHVLTNEQKNAIYFLYKRLEEKATIEKPVLIRGVTGSGKTEVYMHAIERVIEMGKQAIMLVPEISLTPQAVETFVKRFGDKVTVTHSRLSLGERYDQWKKARDGEVSVIIGPRSAIFTPFKNLGIIVIDEEHENTYKSETSPKYDTKEVAFELAKLTGCLVVMGSATPNVETFYQAEIGNYDLITLTERVNKRMPDVEIVDMRFELANGNRSIFSEALKTEIESKLAAKEQIILFINRRGHSTFVSCRSCGYVMQCEECSINYTYHLYTDTLRCHYCGKKEKTPDNCPICGSKYIKYFGVGTQKVVEETEKLFPSAKVLRMDLDTTSKKNSHERIIREFADGKADILVGTQMIAKGLNFPNVSLVGIMAADIAINAGDFRSAENAYQLITQVSGRAGRAELPGKVFIQTYNPEHYSIMFACENNYPEFYEHEIAIRKQMTYPPFSDIFVVLFTGSDEKKIIILLNKLLALMVHYNKKGLFEMLGPAPATISKIRKNYRWKLIIKSKDEALLKSFVFYCIEKLTKTEDTSGVTFNLTMNPALIV